MFGDEASFWLDGTLHRTWARVVAGRRGTSSAVPIFVPESASVHSARGHSDRSNRSDGATRPTNTGHTPATARKRPTKRSAPVEPKSRSKMTLRFPSDQ